MCNLKLWTGLGKADAEIHVIAHTTCLQICQKFEAQACDHILSTWSALQSPQLNFIVYNYHPFNFALFWKFTGVVQRPVCSLLLFLTWRTFFWQQNRKIQLWKPYKFKTVFYSASSLVSKSRPFFNFCSVYQTIEKLFKPSDEFSPKRCTQYFLSFKLVFSQRFLRRFRFAVTVFKPHEIISLTLEESSFCEVAGLKDG